MPVTLAEPESSQAQRKLGFFVPAFLACQCRVKAKGTERRLLRRFFVLQAGRSIPCRQCNPVLMSTVYQDRKTGKRVVQVGGATGGKEDFCLVKGADGVVFYASMNQLMPVDEQGKPDYDARYERPEDPEETVPDPVISLVETRLNINTATAEEIARRVPGIGYRTAKKIKGIQLTLPGETFRNLEQIKVASSRVNWDEVIRQNLIFLG